MIIHAVFATRTYTPREIELVTAWDEYAVDSNPEGYEEDVKTSLASWGSDLDQVVRVDIEVPLGSIYQALDPVKIVAEGTEVVT